MNTKDRNIIEDFFTSIIGIGALFFAYGTVTSNNIRLLIAIIGFFSSIIIWMHVWGIHRDREEIEKVLEKIPNQTILERFRRTTDWRSEGPFAFFYHPPSRMITGYSGLLTLVWLMITVSQAFFTYGFPYNPSGVFLVVGIFAVAFTLVWLHWRRRQDRDKFQTRAYEQPT